MGRRLSASSLAGANLADVVLSIAVNHVLVKVGFAWTVRIVAFIFLFLFLVASLTLKSCITPKAKALMILEFITPFQEIIYWLVTIAGIFVLFRQVSSFQFFHRPSQYIRCLLKASERFTAYHERYQVRRTEVNAILAWSNRYADLV